MALAGSSKPKLRMAFIGAGGISRSHLQALTQMEDVEVVALADVNEQGMQQRADEFNIPRENLFTDYEQMLAKIEPDAVNVCTPNGLHAPDTIASPKAGCPCHC